MKVSQQEFEENVLQLVKIGQKYGRLIFIGLPPVDQTKTDPIPWSPGQAYRNDLIGEYNEIIKNICENNRVQFIDLAKELGKEYIDKLIDGAHPGVEGHRKIYEIIKRFIS